MADQRKNLGCGGTVALFAGGAFLLMIFVGVIGALLDDGEPGSVEGETTESAAVAAEPQTSKPTASPDKAPAKEPDVSALYRVVSDDYMGPYKRTVVVELDEALSKERLLEIGDRIQSDAKRETERTFINVNIPGVDNGELAHWAVLQVEAGSETKVSIYGSMDAAAKETTTPEVSVAELLSEYGNNEVRADNKYKGEQIRVTGKVGEISKDFSGDAYVTIGTGKIYETPVLQCYLLNEAQAVDLSKGDEITVTGRVMGILMNVIARGCVLDPEDVLEAAQ